MNLTVEWVYPYLIKDKPAYAPGEEVGIKPLRDIPVIRVATLRELLRKERNTAIELYTDEARQIFDALLAQLPEEGQ